MVGDSVGGVEEVCTGNVTAGGGVVGDSERFGRCMSETASDSDEEGSVEVLKYKKVANRTKPVATTLPEEYRIVRREHPDPLRDLPMLPTRPPDFVPGQRYTQERYEAMELDSEAFLWEEERKLVHHVIKANEMGLAWDESEKGSFREEFYPPIVMPTIEHTPWNERSIPIPPGILKEVMQYIRNKIASGVYEASNSSYRSNWFCVPKKNGKIRLVHNLQPLNRVTIRDSAVPPFTEQLAERFGGRACYGVLDLFVAFDQRKLDLRSRDLTTFSTPLGTFRLTAIPMGWTNSFQIMQGDVTFALKDEIPANTIPYADDVPIRGPLTRYSAADGAFETIPDNPGIRRFVWEHMEVVNRILHRMKIVGGTFSGQKSVWCAPSAVVLGHLCTIQGREPDKERLQRILDWPPCTSVSEVRSFLGTMGWVRNFIARYALISRPLVELTRKGNVFVFGEREEAAMQELKETLAKSPALKAIDYESGREVVLAVDSSVMGVGFILLQVGEDGKRYPNRFGSIAWNNREKNYSQAKLELYGLMRALRAVRLYIFGVPKLTVEVDAKYIKGMLNNPDVQPNAIVNRWIATILLFQFQLVHVPAAKHTGADGLSRRPRAPEDEDEEEDVEDWIDRVNGFSLWELEKEGVAVCERVGEEGDVLAIESDGEEGVESEGGSEAEEAGESASVVEEVQEVPRDVKAQFRDQGIEQT